MLFVIATLLAGLTCAQQKQSAAQEDQYREWADKMNDEGIAWQPYEVETKDGWVLTMFRLTGRVDKNGEVSACTDGKYPVLIQHGGGMDALSWALSADEAEKTGTNSNGVSSKNIEEWYTKGDSVWPLQMIDHCYDVWMPSNRGSRYSNNHINDGTTKQLSEKDRWSWSYAEMGLYDQPAFIDKILEVTGKDKVTYVGYSNGTAQMFYGLAKLHDEYYAQRLNRFVALAPCVMIEGYTPDQIADKYMAFENSELYYFAGPGWNEKLKTYATDPILSDYYNELAYIPEMWQPYTTAIEVYFMMNAAEGRFQEPISIEDYAAGRRQSDLMDLGSIDQVPVSLVVGQDDYTCSADNARKLYGWLGDTEKYIRYEQSFGHTDFEIGNSRFLARLIETIEYGQAKDDGTNGDMYGDWNGNSMVHNKGDDEEDDDENVVNMLFGLIFEMDSAITAASTSMVAIAIALSLQ